MAVDLSKLSPAELEDLLNRPALEPPGDVEPNFLNPPNNNAAGHAVLATCLTVTTIMVLVRIYNRCWIAKMVKVEDYLGLAGFGTYCGWIAINYWFMNVAGFYVHQWDVQLKTMPELLYIINVGTNLYGVTVACAKTAILLEFCRIFVPWPTRNAFWWTCHILIALNVSFYIATGLFVSNLACIPREKIFNRLLPGTCIDNKLAEVIAAVVNVTSDFIILALPQRVVWKLNMPLKRKLGISLVFAVGVLGCASAAVRLSTSIEWHSSDDVVYSIPSLTLWATAEMTCMYLVFCFPAVPKVFGGQGPMSRLAGSVRSFLGLSSRSTTGAARNKATSSWSVQHVPRTHQPVAPYRKIGESTFVLKDMNRAGTESTQNLQDAGTRVEQNISQRSLA